MNINILCRICLFTFILIQVSCDSGNLKKARIELKNVIQIDPKHVKAYVLHGRLEEENKKTEGSALGRDCIAAV